MEVISNPFWGFSGGLLIGLAAAGLLIINGKIAGVSGILGGSLFSSFSDRSWRLAFLVGLPLGGFFAMRFEAVPDAFEVSADPILLVVAGLLVGVGTQMGGGCTSGHGVCGISRGSARSVMATLTFMFFSAATVFLVRHVLEKS